MNLTAMKRELLKGIEKLKSPTGYLKAGYPRYNNLFGRDSLISAWQMLKIDSSITRATLQTLIEYQGKTVSPKAEEEPGRILHEFRSDRKSQEELPKWDFPYYGSVDSTPLFIVVACEYFKQTGDKTFISGIWENVLAAFRWIKEWGDKDGDSFVEYQRENPHGLFHQGWKDSVNDHLKIKPPVAIVEAQGYVYAAYQSLILLYERLSRNHLSKDMIVMPEVLKKRFNEDFWIEKEGYFTLALDGEKNQKRAVTSNPGHLLFTGIVAQDKVKPLFSRLFKPDLWTPWGIRNHSVEDSDFNPLSYHRGSVWPHDNWIIYKGLRELDLNRHANRIKRALLRAYRVLGKIPELYAVVDNEIVDLNQVEGVWANPLQAWSAAGLLEMVWED